MSRCDTYQAAAAQASRCARLRPQAIATEELAAADIRPRRFAACSRRAAEAESTSETRVLTKGLDRIIGRAAADMIGRDQRALRHHVMARVRVPNPGSVEAVTGRGFTGGSGVRRVLTGDCRRAPHRGSDSRPSNYSERPLRRRSTLVNPACSDAAPPVRRRRALRGDRRDLPLLKLARSDRLPSIYLPAIEELGLVRELEIEALTIEPLTASND